MSRVFVAHDTTLRRPVVVKVLPPDLRSSDSVARFAREIEVAAQLQHPHILPVISAGGNERLLYYVMPYVAGGSLRDQLASGRIMPFTDAIRMSGELLAAVGFAHQRGIVHRDIKPGNVLLSEGHAVLADFGIARLTESLHEIDSGDTSVASPEAYRAPENPRDFAADLYAVAVLTFEMLTGLLPRPNMSASAIMTALVGAHPTARRDRVREISDVLARALAADPGRRYPSAVQFRMALMDHAPPSTVRRDVVSGALLVAIALLLWIATRPAAGSPERVAQPGAGMVRPAANGAAREDARRLASPVTLPRDGSGDAAR